MPSFELVLSEEELAGGAVVVVRLVGEVDVYTHVQLRRCLWGLLERENPPRCIGLDCSEVQFFDSTALGVAVGCRKQMLTRWGRQGLVALVAPSPRVRHIFVITGLTNVFRIVGGAEELVVLAAERSVDAAGDAAESCVIGDGDVN